MYSNGLTAQGMYMTHLMKMQDCSNTRIHVPERPILNVLTFCTTGLTTFLPLSSLSEKTYKDLMTLIVIVQAFNVAWCLVVDQVNVLFVENPASPQKPSFLDLIEKCISETILSSTLT